MKAGTKVNNHYEILQEIGRGGFGTVFSALDLETDTQVAIKVSRSQLILRDSSSISVEYETYLRIFNELSPEGIPRPIELITASERHLLVLPLLGKSAACVFEEQGNFSMERVCDIGCEILTALEAVHDAGFVHLDVKPSNFVFGREADSNVYLIDFGAAKKYVNKEGYQIPFRRGRRFVGTPAFSSMHVDNGAERAPRDDMESLIFSLVALYKGKLPWTDGTWKHARARPNESLKHAKERCRNELCVNMPMSFWEVWNNVKMMGYRDMVDYEGIRELFRRAKGESM